MEKELMTLAVLKNAAYHQVEFYGFGGTEHFIISVETDPRLGDDYLSPSGNFYRLGTRDRNIAIDLACRLLDI